jgi:hypothetical protein
VQRRYGIDVGAQPSWVDAAIEAGAEVNIQTPFSVVAQV